MAKNKITPAQARKAGEILEALFPGVRVTVAPNGTNALWFKPQSDLTGNGFSLEVSAGKAGLGATLRRFVGCEPLTVTGNEAKTYEGLPQHDAGEVSVTVYKPNRYGQAYKAWYGNPASNAMPSDALEGDVQAEGVRAL